MSGFGIQKRGTSPILKQAGSPGPTVPILPEDFAQGPKLPDDIAAKQKPRDTFKKGGQAKDTHVTKDGRVAKKGLYYYMNRAKKLGKSKPGKGTVSDKALKASAKTAKK
jgi:hypothetical protein